MCLPVAITENDFVILPGGLLAGQEEAANFWLHAESGKKS